MERSRLSTMARASVGGSGPDLEGFSANDVKALVHEFEVYQIELEAQNEELRETRLALQQASDRYQDLYDFAPVGYLTLSRAGEILESNLTGCTLLGVNRSDLIGRFFSEFLTWEGGDELYLHLGRVLETRERQSIDLPMSSAGERHLRLESAAAGYQNGSTVCRTAVTDITERKQTDEKLREAKDAAEEASRVKSEFLANMSHEIRTPMTVFMSSIEHLLMIDHHPERRKLLGMANQSAERLRTLIDDILDFSRIEARKVELEEEAFNLRACVRDAVNMFTLLAKEKNLRLEYGLAMEIPERIVGDPGRLGQVLINLIGNAVKFTPTGEINVRVQPRGDFLEFSIADSGIGFPEEKVHLLFESFSQADSSFTRIYGGPGWAWRSPRVWLN